MSPHEAARLLDLPADATPDQIEARFLELRTKIEERIAKAPTPGLKEKYRASLAEITQAHEILAHAADSSSLPVLKQESGDRSQKSGVRPETPALPPAQPSDLRKSRIENRKSGKEFLLVAAIAVAALGAGGWFVLKTRAENAEKARVAAEAKAEQEHQAQLAREKAEQERRAREEAEKDAKQRQDRLFTSLRGRMAELNVTYDALMRIEQTAERELTELKARQRDAARTSPSYSQEPQRLAATVRLVENHVNWLRNLLPAHPAKIARAQAEELLSSRALAEAGDKVKDYTETLDALNRLLRETQQELKSSVDRALVAINTARTAQARKFWGDQMLVPPLSAISLKFMPAVVQRLNADLPLSREEAVAWMTDASAGGDREATHYLALALNEGWGVTADPIRAVALWQKAAEAGHPDSMHMLGWAYTRGTGGLPKNNANGFEWIRKAAESGHLQAIQDYAICHFHGLGVTANPAEAVKWWRRGAAVGDGQSMAWLATAHEEGKGAAKDPDLAMQWLLKSVAARNPRGIANLGYKHWMGEGVPRDDVRAVELWRESAELGNGGAMNNLAYAYEIGRGVPKDPALSLEWRRKSARTGYESAQKFLRDQGLSW